MFGYLIHFCKEYQYRLTIYCDFRYENGFLEYYNNLFQYPFLTFINLWGDFEQAIPQYDAIVLFTDDDLEYNVYDPKILHKTLMIEHSIFRRRTDIPHTLSTRPFDFSLLEEARQCSKFKEFTKPSCPIFALPTYPLYQPNQKPRPAELPRQTTICIVGGFHEYNIDFIHRLQPLPNTDPKIKLHAISRHMEWDKFDHLDKDRFELEIYKNIPIQELIEILKKVDFILTDVAKDNEYLLEKVLMSGCIPLSFSTLTPLILSKQTNQYYQFKNVIEFDKYSHSPIPLHLIDFQQIQDEREQIVQKNNAILEHLFQLIFTTNPV
jgi:hypothetical protein